MNPPVELARPSGQSWSQVAKFVVESIRFRMNIGKDGQYRFQSVHVVETVDLPDFGKTLSNLMVGHTIKEILGNLQPLERLDHALAEELQRFLKSLPPTLV